MCYFLCKIGKKLIKKSAHKFCVHSVDCWERFWILFSCEGRCTSSKHIPYRTKHSFVSILHMFFLFPKNPRIFWKPFSFDWAKNEKRQKCRKLDVCGTFTIPPSTLRVATVSPAGSVGASALKCRGLHRRPAPFTQGRH